MPAFVSQVEFSKNGTGQTGVVAPAFTPGAGNTLFACVWVDGSTSNVGSGTVLSDDTGSNGTWTNFSQADVQSGFGSWSWWYLTNAAATSSTIRATSIAGLRDFPAIYVVEFSGIDTTTPLLTAAAQSQIGPGTGTDAVTSGATGTLSAQPATVFGFAFQTTGIVTPDAGTGYTSLTGVWNFEGSQATSARPMWKHVTATTAVAATATQSSNGNDETAVIVMLDAAAGNTLKTLIGIADASIKNIDGITKANTKTVLGLTP